jgi:hypothetical protein
VHREAQADPEAEEAVGEEQAIEPVGPKIRRKGLQRFRVARRAHVVRDVEELHAPEAEQVRAVRVALAIGEGVVLAMDGHPLLPALSRRQPQHDAKGQVGQGVHPQRPVRQRAVQIDGRRHDGHLGDHDANDQHGPHARHAEAFTVSTLMRSLLVVAGPLGRGRQAPRRADAPRDGYVEPSRPGG